MSKRTCLTCLKSSPAASFIKEGCGINLICDKCWQAGKAGEAIKSLLSEKEAKKNKIHIKEMQVKKLQEDLSSSKCAISNLEKRLDDRKISDIETDLKIKIQEKIQDKFEKASQENESQIFLLNELIGTSRLLSKEMDVKFGNDLKIIDEMRNLRQKMVEQDRKLAFLVQRSKARSEFRSNVSVRGQMMADNCINDLTNVTNLELLAEFDELNKSILEGRNTNFKNKSLNFFETPEKKPKGQVPEQQTGIVSFIQSFGDYLSPSSAAKERLELTELESEPLSTGLEPSVMSTPKPKFKDFLDRTASEDEITEQLKSIDLVSMDDSKCDLTTAKVMSH